MMTFNEYDPLTRVLVRPAREGFGDPDRVAAEWRALNFNAPPDVDVAVAQHAAFASLLEQAGARVEMLAGPGLTLDSIYVRDASIVTPGGVVLCRMGKPARQDEPVAQRRRFDELGVPIAGAVEPPGLIEGGDVVWFDAKTVAVGRGYRTNDAGIAQFRGLLAGDVEVVVVPLPHYRGPADVFHLMSILSPVAEDLAVVYSPLMPVPFREWLVDRGIRFVEVPDSEFESMGANVLAVSPRRVVMIAGNPVTMGRLEAEGVEVWTYEGSEISLKGGGGPTCLTRPLGRG
jgi:N-dimethylarginine dimethylaminohydrolase